MISIAKPIDFNGYQNSKSFFYRLSAETNIKIEALSKTVSDHFILAAEFSVSSLNIKSIQSSVPLRNLKTINTEKHLNFIFVLDQSKEKIPENVNSSDSLILMIKKFVETLNKFAPEKVLETTDSPKSAS